MSYQRYFNLTRSLSSSASAPDDQVYFGERHKALFEQMTIALSTHDSVIVLTGPPGIGKSTIAHAAARTMAPTFAWLNSTPDTRRELVELLLLDRGLSTKDVRRAEGAALWRKSIGDSKHERAIVMVESADKLSDRLLHSLHVMTCAGPRGEFSANLILMGSAGLEASLAHPDLEPLRQRIRLHAAIEPLTGSEMQEFFGCRVRAAGGRAAEIFGPGSLAVLHAYAGGVPRVALNLCESALSLAAMRQEPRVTARIVRHVAIYMHGLDGSVRRADPPADLDVVPPHSPIESTSIEDARTPTEQVLGVDNSDVPTLSDIVDIGSPTCQTVFHQLTGEWPATVAASGDDPREGAKDSTTGDEYTLIYDDDTYEEVLEAALRSNSR